MKTILSIFLGLLFIPQMGFTQDTISGYYEYQTLATERMGEILDLLPDSSFIRYQKRYSETNPIDSGNWSVSNDTVILFSVDSAYFLKIVSKNNLSTFLPDPIRSDTPLNELIPTHWSKTKTYYPNGQIESIRSWSSISNFGHEFIPYGLWIYYYENGAIKSIGRYKKGKKKGEWFYLWPDGTEKQN